MEHFNLENGPKIKPGFKVPDNYFENFTDRLMQQLPEQEVKVIPLYKRTPVWMTAAAAVFAVLFALGLFFQTGAGTMAQPDDAAMENYLVYNTNLTSYDLMQELDQQDIAELENAMSLSDEAIEDYLNYQNIDINE